MFSSFGSSRGNETSPCEHRAVRKREPGSTRCRSSCCEPPLVAKSFLPLLLRRSSINNSLSRFSLRPSHNQMNSTGRERSHSRGANTHPQQQQQHQQGGGGGRPTSGHSQRGGGGGGEEGAYVPPRTSADAYVCFPGSPTLSALADPLDPPESLNSPSPPASPSLSLSPSQSPTYTRSDFDFCNAFWLTPQRSRANHGREETDEERDWGKEGYETVLARVRSGTRGLEELRGVLKER